jgi:hypothetical protein
MLGPEFTLVGTVRDPDGTPTGSIAGLVVREHGLLVVVDAKDAFGRVSTERFSIPGREGEPARVVQVVDGPGGAPRLWTDTDVPGTNGLTELPIWDRGRACWVNPLRPGGPPLAGPS